MSFADQLTLARAAAVPFVVLLYVWDLPGHDYWATGLFALAMATDWFDGRLAGLLENVDSDDFAPRAAPAVGSPRSSRGASRA